MTILKVFFRFQYFFNVLFLLASLSVVFFIVSMVYQEINVFYAIDLFEHIRYMVRVAIQNS
jgi:hypothetical protein